jgi:hypothetical protein
MLPFNQQSTYLFFEKIKIKKMTTFETNDEFTGEWVTFLKTDATYSGASITDDILDSVLYMKRNDDYYRRVLIDDKVNVKWYGAKGDNTTDNFTAFQNAIDNMPEHKTLYFPNGTYLVKGNYSPLISESRTDDGVKIKSNITFLGENKYETFLNAHPDNCFILTTKIRHDVESTHDPDHVKNVHFDSITFMKQDAYFFEQAHLVNLESVSDVTFNNCDFKGWSGDAICIGYNYRINGSAWYESKVENVTITDCSFDGVNHNNRQAITFGEGKNVRITNCSFYRTTSSSSGTEMPGAIDIEPEYTWNTIQDFEISNNTFEEIGGTVGVITIAPWKSYSEMVNKPKNFTFKNNIFKNCNNTFFLTQPNITLDDVDDYNINIAGNVVYNVNRDLRFFLIHGIKGVVISSNTIYNQKFASGIGITYPAGNINIEMNEFLNSRPGELAPLHQLFNVTNYSIHSNTFKDCSFCIIDLSYADSSTSSRGYVHNNVVTNVNQSSSDIYAGTRFLVRSQQSTNADADVRENIIPAFNCIEFQP